MRGIHSSPTFEPVASPYHNPSSGRHGYSSAGSPHHGFSPHHGSRRPSGRGGSHLKLMPLRPAFIPNNQLNTYDPLVSTSGRPDPFRRSSSSAPGGPDDPYHGRTHKLTRKPRKKRREAHGKGSRRKRKGLLRRRRGGRERGEGVADRPGGRRSGGGRHTGSKRTKRDGRLSSTRNKKARRDRVSKRTTESPGEGGETKTGDGGTTAALPATTTEPSRGARSGRDHKAKDERGGRRRGGKGRDSRGGWNSGKRRRESGGPNSPSNSTRKRHRIPPTGGGDATEAALIGTQGGQTTSRYAAPSNCLRGHGSGPVTATPGGPTQGAEASRNDSGVGQRPPVRASSGAGGAQPGPSGTQPHHQSGVRARGGGRSSSARVQERHKTSRRRASARGQVSRMSPTLTGTTTAGGPAAHKAEDTAPSLGKTSSAQPASATSAQAPGRPGHRRGGRGRQNRGGGTSIAELRARRRSRRAAEQGARRRAGRNGGGRRRAHPVASGTPLLPTRLPVVVH